jgi:hypothetical protein
VRVIDIAPYKRLSEGEGVIHAQLIQYKGEKNAR